MLKVIGKIIEYVLYAAILGVALLVLASVVPVPGGVKTYVVRSGSMEPAIKTGAVVVVLPRHEYSVGNVITFQSKNGADITTTHRVAEISGEGQNQEFTTKGDANEEADPQTTKASQVVGRVLFDIPYLGYAVAAAQKPAGFVALVILPALVVIIDQINTLIKEVRRPSSKEEESQDLASEEGTPVGQKNSELLSQRIGSRKTVLMAPRRRLHRTVSGKTKANKASRSVGKRKEAYG